MKHSINRYASYRVIIFARQSTNTTFAAKKLQLILLHIASQNNKIAVHISEFSTIMNGKEIIASMLIIDPYSLNQFPRTREGYEQLVLYSIAAAGHGAWVMARNLELFLALREEASPKSSPFGKVRGLAFEGGQARVAQFMKECGFGTP